MPVRVRVQNFQSIEDAEIVVDGFVAVTGPNNSGKTAFLRAIRALFTNAAPGPYLRTGSAFLSVEIDFGDALVLWEKGWEKPGGKGKSINRYTLNGKTLSGVGRGVPAEVAALGVCEVPAGSQKIWPQIANQFDGALFLLNKSGATVAEALSDVERVGKLTQALRLSEKDRRVSQGEIKVRRGDLKVAEAELSRFEGLKDAGAKLTQAAALRESAQGVGDDLQETATLKAWFDEASAAWSALASFEYDSPSGKAPDSLQKRLGELTPLLARLRRAEASDKALRGFSYASPDAGKAPRIKQVLGVCQQFSARLKRLELENDRLSNAPTQLDFPSPPSRHHLDEASNYRDVLEALVEASDTLEEESLSISQDLKAAEQEVRDLLSERGICPTCNTVHEGHHE